MKKEKKPVIAILFGGCSPEYRVSLQSAYSVMNHIDESNYTLVRIGISPQGSWYLFDGDIEMIASDTWCDMHYCTPVVISPDRTNPHILLRRENTMQQFHIDAVFPLLHGKNGEDGTLQGLFELAGIPIIGCGTLSSALCMDKDRAHQLVKAAGIDVPASFPLTEKEELSTALQKALQIGYPLFVKPMKAGSSFGISKVSSSDELPFAIESARKYDHTIILEECISGFEVGCAIIGNDTWITGEVDEIELTEGFFDFHEKYTLKTSTIHVPARIHSETSDRVKQAAKTIYKALDCKGFARVDFFLSESGKLFFNEVNTIPGFTAHSRFPAMLMASGMTFTQIIDHVIETAFQK